MRRLKFLLCGLALLLSGCVTDGAKALNHQNRGAGEVLFSNPDPSVSAIGADVRDNAAAVEGEIGSPKTPLPYSHQASMDARRSQEAALAARRALLDAIDWAVGAGAALVGLSGVWAWVKKIDLKRMFESTVRGVESLVEDHPEIAKVVKDAVAKQNLDDGVADPVKAAVAAITDAPTK